jgi:two-component system sensor histidine kinase/response regulator
MTNADTRLCQIMVGTGIGVIDWDSSAQVTRHCDGLDVLHGAPITRADDFLRAWLATVHPEDRERCGTALSGCLARGGPCDLLYRVQHPQRGLVRLHLTAFRDVDQGRLLGSVHDITSVIDNIESLRQARDAAHMAQRQAEQVLDLSASLVVALDATGCVTLINPAGAELLGWLPSELLHREWFETCVPPAERDMVRTEFLRVVALVTTDAAQQAKALPSYVNHVLTRNGSLRTMVFRNRFLFDENGRVTGSLSAGMDITDLHNLEDEVQRAREATATVVQEKSAFLSFVSHEMRSPLGSIIGLSGLLLSGPLEAAQRQYATELQECSDALLRQIDDLLDVSKLDAGKLELVDEPFEPLTLVNKAISIVSRRAEAKGLALTSVVGAGIPKILMGDCGRLVQVLVNLLGNAIKFTNTGEVHLHLDALPGAAGGTCCLSMRVTDTGIGLTQATASRLFRPFTQANAGISGRFGGTGLGLTICKALLDRMRGSIHAEGEPGRGSTFTAEAVVGVIDATPLDQGAVRGSAVGMIWSSDPHMLRLREQLAAWGAVVFNVDDASPPIVAAPLVVMCRSADVDAAVIARRRWTSPVRIIAVGEQTALADICLAVPVRINVAVRSCTEAQGDASSSPTATASHVLHVEDSRTIGPLMAEMFRLLGIRVSTVTTGRDALDAVMQVSFNVILLDLNLPDVNGIELASRLRSITGLDGPRLILVTADSTVCMNDALRAAGIEAVRHKPLHMDDLEDLVRGPERRSGIYRRVQQPLVDDIDIGRVRAMTALIGDLSPLFNQLDQQCEQAQLLTRQVISGGDPSMVQNLMHRMRSSLGQFGATKLSGIAAHAERQARDHEMDGLTKTMESFNALARPTLIMLRQYARGHGETQPAKPQDVA